MANCWGTISMNYTRFSKYIRCAISFAVVFHPMMFSLHDNGLTSLMQRYNITAITRSTKALVGLKSIPLRSIETGWRNGYGRDIKDQNRYNRQIYQAIKRWQGLEPVILKSILAQESGFKSEAKNRYGYAGIAQLGKKEARSVGLSTSWGNDERYQVSKAIQACVDILKDKARSLEQSVFSKYGRPQGDEYWKFVAAAYNAGEGTISRAARYAYGSKRPSQISFEDLINSTSGKYWDTPLWRALPKRWNKRAKFKEIKEYALNVVNRARQ